MTDMPSIDSADERPEAPANARDEHGLWRKGTSGNPKGTKKGSRHKASILAETLLDGEANRITRRCIFMAVNQSDPTALRLCMERLLPPVRSRPLRFKLPVLHTVADAQAALAAIVAGMASGEILADEAATLSNVVNSFLKSFELSDLETRLIALEQANAEERPGVHFNA